MKNYKKFMYVENQGVSTVVSLSALIHNIIIYNNFYFFCMTLRFALMGIKITNNFYLLFYHLILFDVYPSALLFPLFLSIKLSILT